MYQHFCETIYGNCDNSLILIGHQNKSTEPYYETFDEIGWDFLNIPYKMVDSINTGNSNDDYNNMHFVAINVFYNIKSIVHALDDTEVYCILDCDVIPIRRYKGLMPTDDTVICFDLYEDWHMFIENPSKSNFNKIEKYLQHKEYNFMNGGFVPILITGKNLKKILDDIIEISIQIVKDSKFDNFGWWCSMAAFQIACHNHKIKCISENNTFIPNINSFDYKTMFAHYSVSPLMSKSNVDSWQTDLFQFNFFYNEVKKWHKEIWPTIK